MTIDPDKVYVVGGLVDVSLKVGHTLAIANSVCYHKCMVCIVSQWQAGIATARLPIAEMMEHDKSKPYRPVLSINQVFNIMMKVASGADWPSALVEEMPARKGYTARDPVGMGEAADENDESEE